MIQRILLILLVASHLYGKKWCFADNHVIEIITDLNANLHMEWNLIIAKPLSKKTQEIEEFLKALDKPVVILRRYGETETDENTGFHEIFGYNVMTVVYWDLKFGKQNLLQIFDTLRKTLKFMHFTPILWIFENGDIKTDKDLLHISQLAFENGFIKVLFYAGKELYIYKPLPFMLIRKLSTLGEFYAQKDITNFHQYPVTFPITSSPPRCYSYKNAAGNRVIAGYFYQILMTFIQQYNFKFVEYDNNSEDRNELLQLLATQKADVLPLKIYKQRSSAASDVLWNSRIIVVVPNAKPIKEFKYFQRPFKKEVWLLYTALIAIITFFVGLLRYSKTKRLDISKIFLYVLAMVIYQSHVQIKKNSIKAKCLYLVVIAYGFMMVQMYLCKLSSLLAVTVYEQQLETLADINATDLKTFGYVDDIEQFLRTPNASPIIIERTTLVDGRDLDNIRRSLNISYFHLGFEDKLDFFMSQQKYLKVPLVRKIDAVLVVDPIFFAMRYNLPYFELFNRYLKYIAASGLLNKIMNELEREGILSGEIQYIEDMPSNSEYLLTLPYFRSPFTLYSIGISLSLLVFVGEIFYFKLYLETRIPVSFYCNI